MSTRATQPRVSVVGVTHDYGSVRALRDVTLTINDGEFVTLLGPSGCGKTTLLRIIAGFERPVSGQILLAGADVTHIPPHRRSVNMVFQRPTLFPHLDVFENVAFGLRIARVPHAEATQRVHDALALVHLEGFERRRSHELSGGQMQRIALARALVNRPQVLLLDEPLSALDLRIRLEMEAELRRVHRETGATFIYVTHDQREALALSDRIAVFDHGCLEQVGTPEEIYFAPTSPFAARFVGDANLIEVDIVVDGGNVFALFAETRILVGGIGQVPLGPAWLILRPEALRLSPDGTGLPAVVEDFAFRGTGFSYRLAVRGLTRPLKAEVPANGRAPVEVGSRVAVHWEPSGCRVLSRDERSTEGQLSEEDD